MARVVEKTKDIKKEQNQEKGKWIFALILSIICVAVLAFIVTIIVLQLTKKDDGSTEEPKYEATYTSENTVGLVDLTWDQYKDLIDVNKATNLAKPVVYIYIYSPNYDSYKKNDKTYGNDEELVGLIKEASEAFKDSEETGFYILNTLSDDNKDVTASVDISSYGIALLKITNDEVETTDYKVIDIVNTLNDILSK